MVASALFNGVRAHLIAQGRWESLEEAVIAERADLADWLADAESAPWLPLEPLFAVMAGLQRALAPEGMRELGRERLRADLETGALAPMLRAWIREFASDPTALMRVSPHLWQAITQHAGAMRLVAADPTRVEFRIAGAPGGLLEASGWHRLFEGFGGELMRRSGRQGSVSVSALVDSGELALVGDWSSVEA